MKKTELIVLSGFLGAGKTTLMLAAAELLRASGKSVACITNDQGSNLVDSKMVFKKEIPLQQIEGGCFCCRFDQLVDSINEIIAGHQPDVILAEAVGSCTDLAATVIKPLQSYHGDLLEVRPLTTVVDPERLSEHLSKTSLFSPEISYVYQKQLEEAHCIVLNKSDTCPAEEINDLCKKILEKFHGCHLIPLSALTGNGVQQWTRQIVSENVSGSGSVRVLDIDYDLYAEGESHLGWLNASYSIKGKLFDAEQMSKAVFVHMFTKLTKQGAEVAHCKLWAQDGTTDLKISAVNNRAYSMDRKTSGLWFSDELTIWTNARVYSEPEQLLEVFKETVSSIKEKYGVEIDIMQLDCFAPARPVPTYRIV